jgi:hypothetical protein
VADALFLIPDDILCIEIEPFDVCKALMPGGFELESPDLLGMMQPALAPLVPLFNVLEAIVAIKKCVEAIPDALGPPPDPSKMIDCIPNLAEKVAALLKLLPPLSIPTMIKQLLNCIIREIGKFRSFIVGLQQQMLRIARIVERAAELEDPEFNLIAVCAADRVASQLSNEMKALVVVGRLLGMARELLKLAEVPVEIPDLESLAGQPLDTVIEPIDALLDTLRQVRDAVPDVLFGLDPAELT